MVFRGGGWEELVVSSDVEDCEGVGLSSGVEDLEEEAGSSDVEGWGVEVAEYEGGTVWLRYSLLERTEDTDSSEDDSSEESNRAVFGGGNGIIMALVWVWVSQRRSTYYGRTALASQ
jgi:hypothetical protein